MVVPTPTALPWTAATIGLSTSLIVSMKWWAGLSTALSPRAWLAKSARSLPAVKLSPSPWNTMTRTDGSSSALLSASDRALYMAPVSAFFFSGRCNVNVRTPSDISLFTCSVTALSSGDRAGRLGSNGPIEEASQPLTDDLLGLGHDAIDQLLDRQIGRAHV